MSNKSQYPNGAAAVAARKQELKRLLLKERGIQAQVSEPIQRRSESAQVPLSFNQEGLWFIEQFDPGKPNYVVPGAVRIRGPIDVAALGRALGEIVRRHESLRTTIVAGENGPCQIVAPPQPFELPTVDLQSLDHVARESELVRLATRDAAKPLDLTKGPLFVAFLVRLSADEHALIFRIHHIVSDGWSFGVLTRELTVLYEAFSQNKPSPLADLPVQFGDFVIWERQRLSGNAWRKITSYWRTQLDGHPPSSELPTDRPRPQLRTFNSRRRAIRFSKKLSEQLRSLSRSHDVTLNVTMMAAFFILLRHYTGQDDLVVGTTFANRSRRELEELIGYFVTVLPIRCNLAGKTRFQDLLSQLHKLVLDAGTHQEIPLAKLVGDLPTDRHPSRNPFFQVVFYVLTPDHNPSVFGFGIPPVQQSLKMSELALTPLEIDGGLSSGFDVAVVIWDMPDGLAGTVEYSADLYEDATIERLISHYETLVREIIDKPDTRLDSLASRLRDQQTEERESRERAAKEGIHQKLKNLKSRSKRIAR